MVTFNNKRAKLQKRRAISTIVGGAIFLVLFASAFSTFFIAIDFQRDTINTQRAISESMLEKTQEQFGIAVSTDSSRDNKLGIQVKNQGTNAVEIGNIWIINKSGDYPAEKHLINYTDAIIPPGYGANILENTHFNMDADNYDIKVVSTLGTIKKADLSVGSSNHLRATLIAIPPDVKVGQNVTLTMHVENIGYSSLLNVQPVGGLPTVTPVFTSPNPPIPIPVNLDPGEGAFFTWEYETTGTSGTIVEFTSSATAEEEDTKFIFNSNTSVEKIELKEPDETEITVLNQDLLARPEIFLIIPAPFGAGETIPLTEKAVWGMNIVNPTDQDMYVSKITISALTTRAQGNDKIFNSNSGPSNCAPTTIAPTRDFWSCPAMNQLVWKNVDVPELIPPYTTVPFLAKVKSGSLASSSVHLETVIVAGNVFTTLGEFGKAGYGTAVRNGDSALVNVFLTDEEHLIQESNIISNITNIQSGETVKFNATFADYEKGAISTWNVDGGSRLIINIPRDWQLIEPSINPFGDFTTQVFNYADGSSQIIGDLNADFNGNDDRGKTIQFDAIAPTVSTKQMYVMYLLADGKVESGSDEFALGPLAEVILQVVP